MRGNVGRIHSQISQTNYRCGVDEYVGEESLEFSEKGVRTYKYVFP